MVSITTALSISTVSIFYELFKRAFNIHFSDENNEI
jgi:hypothetical protein